jgi:hypothetical protein
MTYKMIALLLNPLAPGYSFQESFRALYDMLATPSWVKTRG